MNTNIFTYGSLMFPDVIQSIIKHNYRHQMAFTKNIQRRKIIGDVYPVASVKREALPLQGRIYFNVNCFDLEKLDIFEGDFYFRKTIQIFEKQDDDNAFCKADIYLIKPKYKRLISKNAWSVEEFESKYLRQFNQGYPRRG